jgi:transcriptional regulator with XRE-family HTH domain
VTEADPRIESSVTIVWGLERGMRLALWRMVRRWTQAEMGKRLGVRQQVIQGLESGQRTICEEITLRAFSGLVGDGLAFILFGDNAGAYADAEQVKREFWQFCADKHKHKKRIAKRTNAQKIEIDGWRKTERGLVRSGDIKKTDRRGNRTPGPRTKWKEEGEQ